MEYAVEISFSTDDHDLVNSLRSPLSNSESSLQEMMGGYPEAIKDRLQRLLEEYDGILFDLEFAEHIDSTLILHYIYGQDAPEFAEDFLLILHQLGCTSLKAVCSEDDTELHITCDSKGVVREEERFS